MSTLRTIDGAIVGPDDIVWFQDASESMPAGEVDPDDLDVMWYSSERLALESMIREYDIDIRYESDRIEEMEENISAMQDAIAKLKHYLTTLTT